MNDLPRHTLARIILEHGRAICDAPKRVEALLRDLCGAHRREINIIIGALEERVAADLLAARGTVPRDALLARLAARLRDNLAYTPEAARWGVETWALALGTISEAELRERARAESTEDGRGGASPQARDAEPPAANPARVAPPASQPSRGTTHAPPQQPTQSPKASQPPTVVTPPAPAPRRAPTIHPSAPPVPRTPRQSVAPPPPARDASRRGLTLRGCLIGVMLIIVLIVAAVFVVPAVIMILKEEQAQPSINDPRIR
ncbi:MAG TPA: hypothetical protein VIQ24_22270 [Pyrinomonadaceae bacterium]